MTLDMLGTIVEKIAEQRDNAKRQAARIREYQKAARLPIDTRGDYAEGSAAAYAMALSIIAGVAGIPDALELVERDHDGV